MRRLLLAHDEGRLQEICPTLQAVSAARRLAQGALRRVEVNLQPLAVPHVGNRHSGTLLASDQANEVFGRGDRILHQMDRGRTSSPDHCTQNPEFRVEKIVSRFGVPKRLVSENGTQFASHLLKKLCEDIGMQQVFASLEHPQTNGQLDSANRVLLRGLKRRLEKAKGSWAEEVPRIVWSYHTTEQSGTHETPFSLVYGCDAMIPVEIQESSPGFQNFVADDSNEERRMNLDLLDEVREEARVKAEAVKRRVERKYNSKIKPRNFRDGDLVMRKAHQYERENKLSPKWTGPFRITEALVNDAYRLETLEGGAIPRTWNTTHLKFYYS